VEALETLKADEVAQVLKVRLSRIYEMAREEKKYFGLGVVLRMGRQVRFSRPALCAWIERGGVVECEVNDDRK
jgi:excisionase family DNA binding protein